MDTSKESASSPDLDPVFVDSRREGLIIFCVWIACLCWAIPYCYHYGYVTEFAPNHFQLTWGMPSWVFGGILVPWLLATVFSVCFCAFVMKDNDLNAAAEAVQTKKDSDNANSDNVGRE